MAGRQGWPERPQLEICADGETFRRRWRGLYSDPLVSWLEELRMTLESRGLPSTIPPADPQDRHGHLLAVKVQPGIEPLLSLDPGPSGQALASMSDVTAASPALGYVASLLAIVGSGTRLTAKGNLTLADGRKLAEAMGCGHLLDERIGDRVFKTKSSSEIEPVDLMLRWARTAGFVRLEHGKLLPTAKGWRFGKSTADDWMALLRAAAFKLNWVVHRHSWDRKPFWADLVTECTPSYLQIAVDADPRGIAVLPLAQSTWRLVEERWVTDDLSEEQVQWQQSSIASAIRRGLFFPLQLLGCAETWRGAAHGAVRMSPLGIRAVARLVGELQPSRTRSKRSLTSRVVDLSSWRSGRP